MELPVKKLAYITSMSTGGLAGFNYREIVEMTNLGTKINLFITKYVKGPYMPPPKIPVFTTDSIKVILSQPARFLSSPRQYGKLVLEAIETGTLVDLMIAQKWAPIMAKNRMEWIHCHWGDHKLYIGYYCHKMTGLPLSVTMHGYDLYDNPNWAMLERCLKECDQIITISDYNKNLLKKKYGTLGDRVKVVRLSADSPEDPEIEINRKYLLIVGGFQPRKGYDTLIKAMHSLGRKDLHLWIVGYKGPVNVRKLVEDYNLNNQVTIFGHVSDEVLKLLYKKCDIFCMPSRFPPDGVGEGLPVSLMEAMSYGKPVVATYHTGIPELVPEILVQENDWEGLAKGIARLADDPSLRQEMGKRNREIIRKNYSSENIRKLILSFEQKKQ